jgi:ring-1,2-phenylacetyl-CoA epoxidase subunit PaaD
VEAAVRALGAAEVHVRLVFSPPWSTDAITPAAREKLRAFGLAPAPPHGGLIPLMFPEEVICPHCGSNQTALKNSFGPTLCRALYYCRHCQQPFEQFKAL